MPELPEVETVRRQLARVLVGRTIEGITSTRPSYFFVTSPRRLKALLPFKKVTGLERLGKALVLHLNDGSRLLLHLGMTGQLVTGALPQDGHVHLVFHLSGGKVISFRDVRKFGKVEWIGPGESSKRLDKLGPDALSIETPQLRASLHGRRVAIKSALLNQEILAGVGNIYADEALHAALIHPTKMAGKLTRPEVERLNDALVTILKRAVAAGGSTINDYMRPDGELGGFQNWHQVYGKKGEPCPRCKAAITRIVVGGRGTHYCAKCQR